jgi:uncharacterized membrane protein
VLTNIYKRAIYILVFALCLPTVALSEDLCVPTYISFFQWGMEYSPMTVAVSGMVFGQAIAVKQRPLAAGQTMVITSPAYASTRSQ